MLEVEGLETAYGPVRALDGVSFSVPAGSITAVLGANGAGNGTGATATPGEPITTGTIVSVSGSTAMNGSTAAVTLAVPETDAGVLACYASAQDVAIALTPRSG